MKRSNIVRLRQVLRGLKAQPKLLAVETALLVAGCALAFYSLLLGMIFWAVSRRILQGWLAKRLKGDVMRHVFWLERAYDTIFIVMLAVYSTVIAIMSPVTTERYLFFGLTALLVALYGLHTYVTLFLAKRREAHIKTHGVNELFGSPKGRMIEGRLARAALIVGGLSAVPLVLTAMIVIPQLYLTYPQGMEWTSAVDAVAVYSCWTTLAVAYIRLLGRAFIVTPRFIVLQLLALAGTVAVAIFQTVHSADMGYRVEMLIPLAPLLGAPFIYLAIRRRVNARAAIQ
ncbi:hypothetical protein JNJ66_01065 [Candidatus Saccharibacteria bacterium]|nr:hypothetical protein [Candidatus Saccharibacteria bacterium]